MFAAADVFAESAREAWERAVNAADLPFLARFIALTLGDFAASDEGPVTVAELVDTTELPGSTIRTHLRRLLDDHWAEQVGP